MLPLQDKRQKKQKDIQEIQSSHSYRQLKFIPFLLCGWKWQHWRNQGRQAVCVRQLPEKNVFQRPQRPVGGPECLQCLCVKKQTRHASKPFKALLNWRIRAACRLLHAGVKSAQLNYLLRTFFLWSGLALRLFARTIGFKVLDQHIEKADLLS